MATHLPSTAQLPSSANNTNTASLMEDDAFDLDEAALAAAVDSIIENHNKESEKVRSRGREGPKRKSKKHGSNFNPRRRGSGKTHAACWNLPLCLQPHHQQNAFLQHTKKKKRT